MPKGGSRTARYAAPSRDTYKDAPAAVHFGGRGLDAPCQQPNAKAGGRGQNSWDATAARFGGRGQGFLLDGPRQQPNARAGGRSQSPWLEAEDEVITSIPMPFGLTRDSGSDSSSTGSHDDCLREPGCAPPQVQKLRQAMAPKPFKLSAGQCDGYPGPWTARGGSNALESPEGQRAESGLNGSTTVMIRRIPQTLSQRKLVWELESAGFAHLYDYIYIPLDRGLLARPMVFVNFTSGEAAERFYQVFDGRPLRICGSVEPVFVIPATVQGLAPNLAHHLACMRKNTDGRQKSELGPLFMI
mmetsp:Transcript_126041/g.356403  ORF Transcript_126041/g.356403 Transcript_126041/m.356403 type:complete len:300 (+) Transcript_126041:82-981(+)